MVRNDLRCLKPPATIPGTAATVSNTLHNTIHPIHTITTTTHPMSTSSEPRRRGRGMDRPCMVIVSFSKEEAGDGHKEVNEQFGHLETESGGREGGNRAELLQLLISNRWRRQLAPVHQAVMLKISSGDELLRLLSDPPIGPEAAPHTGVIALLLHSSGVSDSGGTARPRGGGCGVEEALVDGEERRFVWCELSSSSSQSARQ